MDPVGCGIYESTLPQIKLLTNFMNCSPHLARQEISHSYGTQNSITVQEAISPWPCVYSRYFDAALYLCIFAIWYMFHWLRCQVL